MHVVGIDVHKHFCEISRINRTGREVDHLRLKTSLHDLIQYFDTVKSQLKDQLHIVFEEGELSGWLYRGLVPHAAKVISADPQKNSLIFKYGSKTDKIDSLKIAQLYKGGYINPVYHTDSEERAELKNTVLMYHKITKDVVRNKARLKSLYRRYGIMIDGKEIYNPKYRDKYLAKIHNNQNAKMLFELLDMFVESKLKLEKTIKQSNKHIPIISKLKAIPGFGDITATTFFVIIDTPYRFHKKSQLWSYANLGRRVAESGGKEKTKRQITGNKILKNCITTVYTNAMKSDNKFSKTFMRLVSINGKDHQIARRIVCRKILTTAWSMWKNNSQYDDKY